MDPLSLAGAFATIVGLLSNFKAERSGRELADFIQWLRDTHQEDMASAIGAHKLLASELSTLLATSHEELTNRLSRLNEQIALVAAQFTGFAAIAQSLGQSPSLSDQAKFVLKQIASSKAKLVMEHKMVSGTSYIFVDGAAGEVSISEPRFVVEDFDSLVSMGLLRDEFTPKGTRRFFVTRAGVALATAIHG